MYWFNRRAHHTFKRKGGYYLLHTKNLALLKLAPVSFHLLNLDFPIQRIQLYTTLHPQFTRVQVDNAIRKLVEWKILTTSNTFERSEPDRTRTLLATDGKLYLDGLYLVVHQDCNLRCRYCSAGFGRFGREPSKKKMDVQTARRAIDFLLDNSRSGAETYLIAFMGGEPLLNFPVIKAAVDYFRSRTAKKADFFFNTNGVLLTKEFAKWFADNNVTVRFSIDGTATMHNQNRVYPDGGGSYDDVMKGVRNYQAINKSPFIAQASIPHGESVVEAVHDLWRIGAGYVFCNPTSESWFLDTSKAVSITRQDQSGFAEQLNELAEETARELTELGYRHMTSYTGVFLAKLHSREVKLGCGVGHSISVLPDGSLYPCQGFVGLDGSDFGSLEEGFKFQKIREFDSKLRSYVAKCDGCWAQYICSVNCMAMATGYSELDSTSDPSRLCELTKSVIESTAAIYADIRDKRPEALDRLFTKTKKS